MVKVRNKVFETNSSSVHTVTFDRTPEDGLYKPDCHGEPCTVSMGEFGWSGVCNSWRNKFSYLTLIIWETIPYKEQQEINGSLWCSDKDKYENAINFLKNHPDYQRIEKLVCENINASEIVWVGEGYIDHQSYEDFGNLAGWLKYNNINGDDEIVNFIFGNSWIDISNDNC